MKKFQLLTFAILALLVCGAFSACSDDDNDDKGDMTEEKDDNTNSLESQLIGTWIADYSGDSYYTQWGYKFNSNKTGIAIEGGELGSITWRLSGKTIIITYDDSDFIESYTVKYIDDERMHVSGHDDYASLEKDYDFWFYKVD